MNSPIQNVGQQPGAFSHHAEVEPDETAYAPERALLGGTQAQPNPPPGHSQHAAPTGDRAPTGNRDPSGANPTGQTTPNGNGPNGLGPNGLGPNGNGPNGLGPPGHSQHGLDNGLGQQGNGFGPQGNQGNGFGPQGNQGNGLGNGLGSLVGNGLNGSGGVGFGNGNFGASGVWGGNNGNQGIGGFLGDTLGGLLGGSSSGGALAALGNFAGIVQNTVGFAQNPVGQTLYAVNEGVAQRTRPGEPIMDSDPDSSRAPVRSDSPGTTTSTSERPPSGSETNVFVRAASSDPSSVVPNALRSATTSPNPTPTNPAHANAPVAEVVVREPAVPARAPASETVVARTDNASSASKALDPAGTSSPTLLAGTAAPAQAGGELAVARFATPLTLIAAAPFASDGETVSEVGRMALFRADAGDGRESVQDIYGRNYVVYASDGRNVEKPGNDRAIKAIGMSNIDAIAEDRAANHGELSTHELVWKTVVPALVGVGALFGGAGAAGLAVAGSGGAAPFLLSSATVIFGYGALRASLALRDRASAGVEMGPLQNADARRHWIAAGANTAGMLASLALMIA